MARSLTSTIQAANAALLVDGDLAAVDLFFAPDYVAHLTDRDQKGGHAWVRRFLRMIRRAFPDVQVTVAILVQAKQRVAWQRTLRGTHRGDFAGFPATGKRVVWRDMITSQFRAGRFAEDWVVSDLAERLVRARAG